MKETVIGIIDLPKSLGRIDLEAILDSINIWESPVLLISKDDPHLKDFKDIAFDQELTIDTVLTGDDIRWSIGERCDYLLCGPLDDMGRDDILENIEKRDVFCTVIEVD